MAARLEAAVDAFRDRTADDARARATRLGATQNNLSVALGTLGEREWPARLEQALDALFVPHCWKCAQRALRWAMAQNNANALRLLGAQSGTARLEAAVDVPRRAQERTHERVPLDWAMAQNNLGVALGSGTRGRRGGAESGRRLPRRAQGMDPRAHAHPMGDGAEQPRRRASGTRERESGTARLEQAVDAFRDRSRNGPASACHSNGRWRRTTSASRFGLGERERHGAAGAGGRRLRDALKEWTRERVPPMDMAPEQRRQRASFARGTRERHDAAGQAVDAFRDALRNGPRARAADWARTQDNLGLALARARQRGKRHARLDEMIAYNGR